MALAWTCVSPTSTFLSTQNVVSNTRQVCFRTRSVINDDKAVALRVHLVGRSIPRQVCIDCKPQSISRSSPAYARVALSPQICAGTGWSARQAY